MGSLDDLFAAMDKAPLNSKGKYMGAGNFIVAPKVIKYKVGHKGKSFIHEFEILKTSNPDHPVGSSGCQVTKLEKDQAWGDIKAFMLAIACGVDPKTIKDPPGDSALHAAAKAFAMAALDPAYAAKLDPPQEPDFLIGIPVKLECVVIKTLKGTDFTVHNWSPVSEAEVEALRG